MTGDSGQTAVDSRADEIARYVEEVRAELRDLPSPERDELLEDLPAHLSEVVADDPTPLRDRLGPPVAYAAELRAALDPDLTGGHRRHRHDRWAVQLTGWWERTRGRLDGLDRRVGPPLGYARISEFGRVLVPAWWVIRGYLAAMLVTTLLNYGPTAVGAVPNTEIGLLPRFGGTTLVALIIVVASIAGSVWFARRFPRPSRWPRLVVLGVSAYLLWFGVSMFIDVDNRRWDGNLDVTQYVTVDPYEHVEDIYPVDEEGRLLTGVTLLDQDGTPIEPDGGWIMCEAPAWSYPRCLENAPSWLDPAPPTPDAGG
jgi:HAAS domain-containing protein